MTVLVNSGTTIGIPAGGITLTDDGTIAGGLNGTGTIDGPFNLQVLPTGALLSSAGPIWIDTDQLLNQGTIGLQTFPFPGNAVNVTIESSVSLANLSDGTLSGGTWQGDIAFLDGTIGTDNATIVITGTTTEQGASGAQPILNTLTSITPTGTLNLGGTLGLGSSWSAPGSLVDSGHLTMTSFSTLNIAGGLTVASGGTLNSLGTIVAPSGVTIAAGGTMVNATVLGPVTVDGAAQSLTVSGAIGGTSTVNGLTLRPGATLLPGLTASFVSAGGGAASGTILVEGPTGDINVLAGSTATAIPTVEIATSFSNTVTLPLTKASEIVLQSPGAFTGTLNSVDNNATIVLDGIVANGASLGPLTETQLPSFFIGSFGSEPFLSSGSLSLLNNGSVVYDLELAFDAAVTQFFQGGPRLGPSFEQITGQDYSSAVFTATPDPLNNQTTITATGIVDLDEDIITQTFCFVAGTRIATFDGEVPIEQLKPGDRLIAHFGGERRVVWTGHRVLDRSDAAVGVVRIAAGAFGEGRPERDLSLSPDHAVFVDDVLIPARYLVNGTTIREVAMDTVTFWHVELDAHDVLLAEGLPAESFLDIGDRSFFSEYDRATRSDMWREGLAWEVTTCAPLIVTGPKLAAARARVREAELV